MKYGKIIDDELQLSPHRVIYNGMQIYNPPADVLLALGYKPVRFQDPPDVPQGYMLVESWQETSEEILQIWTLIPEEE